MPCRKSVSPRRRRTPVHSKSTKPRRCVSIFMSLRKARARPKSGPAVARVTNSKPRLTCRISPNREMCSKRSLGSSNQRLLWPPLPRVRRRRRRLQPSLHRQSCPSLRRQRRQALPLELHQHLSRREWLRRLFILQQPPCRYSRRRQHRPLQ